HARCGHADPHLSRVKLGVGALLHLQHAGSAMLGNDYGAHRGQPIRSSLQRSTTAQPSTKPSEATISETTSAGTSVSVVTTIAANRWASPSACPSGVWPTAAEEMLIPCFPKIVPTRPIMPGRSA